MFGCFDNYFSGLLYRFVWFFCLKKKNILPSFEACNFLLLNSWNNFCVYEPKKIEYQNDGKENRKKNKSAMKIDVKKKKEKIFITSKILLLLLFIEKINKNYQNNVVINTDNEVNFYFI